MLAQFSMRFVIAAFGGALAGLLVGLFGRYVLGADWNVFLVMAAGIMAGSLGLALTHTMQTERLGARERTDADGT